MRFTHKLTRCCVHLLAFAMALLELLLRCFRRRKPPASEQHRPLYASDDLAASERYTDAIRDSSQTPRISTRPAAYPVAEALEFENTLRSSAEAYQPQFVGLATADSDAGPLTPQVACLPGRFIPHFELACLPCQCLRKVSVGSAQCSAAGYNSASR